MPKTSVQPVDRFAKALNDLIDDWRDKPEGSKLSNAEAVGVLAFAQHEILREGIDDQVVTRRRIER